MVWIAARYSLATFRVRTSPLVGVPLTLAEPLLILGVRWDGVVGVAVQLFDFKHRVSFRLLAMK